MENPTLAVVTRLSRSAAYLERVYMGLSQQTNVHIVWSIVAQIPVSDAHSTILDKARNSGIDVIVTSVEDGISLGELANIGVRATQTEFVILHDDDDQVRAGFFERAIAILQDSKHSAIACHAAIIHETVLNGSKSLDFVRSPGRRIVDYSVLQSNNLICTNALIFRRDAFDRIGGYRTDVDVGEDWLFNLALAHQEAICILPNVYATVFVRKRTNKTHEEDQSNTVIRAKEAHNAIEAEIRKKYGIEAGNIGHSHPFNSRLQRWLDRIVYLLTRRFLPRV